MRGIVLEVRGSKLCVYGNTYPLRKELRKIGFTWTGESWEYELPVFEGDDKVNSVMIKQVKQVKQLAEELMFNFKIIKGRTVTYGQLEALQQNNLL